MKNYKKFLASTLAVTVVVTTSSCSNDGGRTEESSQTPAATTVVTTTFETDAVLQEIVDSKAEEYKTEGIEKIDKKITWLSHYVIDETSAAAELFKAQYGIPEEGNQEYGEDANDIFEYINVAYNDRFDKLGALIASGDSPDMFSFDMDHFPVAAYTNMFQPIDGIIDTNSELWSKYRDDMDEFMWDGKNWCPITEVTPNYVLWYRRSVMEEVGLEDPLIHYNNGEWNWDKFLEYASIFQQTGDSKYVIDGWNISDFFIATGGVPMVSIENGQLKGNFNDPAVERAMSFIETLSKEDYRYPWDLNGWSTNFRAWANGDTLFYADGYWMYGEQTMQKCLEMYEWEASDIFFVPFPKDPNADAHYQLMMQSSNMLVAGADNIDGYAAWNNCVMASMTDPEVTAQSREKLKRDSGWTDEQLDFKDRLNEELVGVYDFKYGLSIVCAGDNSPTRALGNCYTFADASYTQLRDENINIINTQIEGANAQAAE